MDKKAAAATKPSTDDESTSTASEIFDSWTLVTEKKTKGEPDNRIEILRTTKLEEHTSASEEDDDDDSDDDDSDDDSDEDSDEDEPIKTKPVQHVPAVDELSDSISIISESESAGRISPHANLSEHISNLNLKFTTGDCCKLPSHASGIDAETTSNGSMSPAGELRQRRRTHSTSSSFDESVEELDSSNEYGELNYSVVHGIYRFIRKACLLFMVAVTLATLFGFYPSPSWNEYEVREFKELRSDMKYMRAELDILTKQVIFLKNLKAPKINQDIKFEHKKPIIDQHGAEKTIIKQHDAEEPKIDRAAKLIIDQNGAEKTIIKQHDAEEPKIDRAAKLIIDQNGAEKSIIDQLKDQLRKLDKPGALSKSDFEALEQKTIKMFGGKKDEPREEKQEKNSDDSWEEGYGSFKAEYKAPADVHISSKEQSDPETNGKIQNMNTHINDVYSNENDDDSDENDDDSKKYNDFKKVMKSIKDRLDKYSAEKHQRKQKQQKHRQGSGYSSDSDENKKDGSWQEKHAQHREHARAQHDFEQNNENKNRYVKRVRSGEKSRHS